MPHIYFETDRLVVRQWTLEDADALYAIMSDARMHIYAHGGQWTRERTEKYIQFMLDKNFTSLDCFHGACAQKETGRLIGYTGLNPYKPGQPELEWKLGPAFWGAGYATEVGKAAVDGAFRTTAVECIYGIAHPDNKASCRALEKVGMTCLGLNVFRGEQYMFYRIDRRSSTCEGC